MRSSRIQPDPLQNGPRRGALAAALVMLSAAAAACDGTPGATGSGGAGGGSSTAGGGGEAGTTAGQGGTGGDLGLPPGTGGAGQGGAGGAQACGTILKAIVRDFSVSHPDFEDYLGADPGIVAPMLGPDGKPVYAGSPTTPTTSGKESFDQWFRDVPGVNLPIPVDLELSLVGNGLYTYASSAFFPIDGQGFGDEGNIHNYHFTLELRTQFMYEGGEVFSFTGDDDLFTFINGHLVIDLGGVHGAMSASVDLDERAAELGIEKGKTYPLDFFFAERHTSESNFKIDTTIGCFSEQPVPE